MKAYTFKHWFDLFLFALPTFVCWIMISTAVVGVMYFAVASMSELSRLI